MTTIFAPTALLPDEWAENVLIEVDKDGWIVGVDQSKAVSEKGDVDFIEGALVPGIPNTHSHAFQRAMAGLAERASGRKDNFWSWRETMYSFVSRLDPEDMGVLAAQVYVEMLKAGYTTVGEFHYIHHQVGGMPYEERALLSEKIIQAALRTGISITHLPVLYAYSGFDEQPPVGDQKRFINTVPEMEKIIESLQGAYGHLSQVTLGLAHHSLRAVSPEMLREGTEMVRAILPDAPIHMHIAEQSREVEDCLDWSDQRPVEYLLEHGNIDQNWTLVHATHMTDEELKAVANSGVIVSICPTTEANLGDGVFRLAEYFHAGGKFSIGSDSHISVSPIEELRWLEYTQRLLYQERTLISRPNNASVGAVLFESALRGGAQSLGRKIGKIEIGYRADFLVLDQTSSFMAGKLRDHILDAAIFASHENPVKDVMVGGHWVVKNRHHKQEEDILAYYKKTIEKFR